MAVTDLPSTTSTTGNLGLWNGTVDGERAFLDYANGTTNLRPLKEVNMTCHDMRHMKQKPTLVGSGYEYRHFPTAITTDQFVNFKDPEVRKHINDVYYKECVELIESATENRAAEIFPISFRVRQEKADSMSKMKDADARMAPRPIAHLDRDLDSATINLKEAGTSEHSSKVVRTDTEQALGEDKAHELLSKYTRWSQINVWRPVGDVAKKWPLCFLNHDSFQSWSYDKHVDRLWNRNDPRVSERGVKLYDCIAKFDSRYQYHYTSDMGVDECFVFCSFDSDERFAIPHGAFWDDKTSADAPNRRSSEFRSLVFWKD